MGSAPRLPPGNRQHPVPSTLWTAGCHCHLHLSLNASSEKGLRVPRAHATMSLLSELTLAELLCTMPSSGGRGLCAGGTSIDPALLYVPTGGRTLEASSFVEDKQGMTALHYGDEAFLPSQFHQPRAGTEAFSACIPSAPQYNPPTHDSDLEVSATSFPMIRVQINVP